MVQNAKISGSLRSPTLFNNIINNTSLKIYENDTWTYFIPSFYTAATVVNEEGKFYSKMQDF